MPARRFFRRTLPPSPSCSGEGAADAVASGYVAWRAACFGVQAAYERWTRWEPSDRAVAFTLYMAALEHEENAARVYEREIERMPSVGALRAPARYGLQGAA